MDWRFSFILILTLFSMVFGWQMALFVPPEDYRLAAYVLCGAVVLVCLVGAAGGSKRV